jgi:hypothetical protein
MKTIGADQDLENDANSSKLRDLFLDAFVEIKQINDEYLINSLMAK